MDQITLYAGARIEDDPDAVPAAAEPIGFDPPMILLTPTPVAVPLRHVEAAAEMLRVLDHWRKGAKSP